MCFYHFQKQNSTCKCCSSEEKLLWVLNLVLLCYVLHSYTIYNIFLNYFFTKLVGSLDDNYIFFCDVCMQVFLAMPDRIDYEKMCCFRQIRKANSHFQFIFFSTTQFTKYVLSVAVLYFFSIFIFYCCSPSKDALEFPISDTYFNFANY